MELRWVSEATVVRNTEQFQCVSFAFIFHLKCIAKHYFTKGSGIFSWPESHLQHNAPCQTITANGKERGHSELTWIWCKVSKRTTLIQQNLNDLRCTNTQLKNNPVVILQPHQQQFSCICALIPKTHKLINDVTPARIKSCIYTTRSVFSAEN